MNYARKLLDECKVTGVTPRDAAVAAARWWQEYRGAVRADFNLSTGKPRVRAPGQRFPSIIIKDSAEYVIPSGLLSAKPWAELTHEEQIAVTYHWHHENRFKAMAADEVTT